MAKTTTTSRRRVQELDGLRGIAILAVIFYRFFQRFADDYPYGNTMYPWMSYGYLGVHLFFVISGFVIAFTLERVSGPVMFVRHRFLRLWPTMVVCSIITFAVMHLVDTPFTELWRVGIGGFLPSWTFTAPYLWKHFIEIENYVDGAYWSLFVEVRFYFWAMFIATVFGTRLLAPILFSAVAILVPLWHLYVDPALHFFLNTFFFVPYLPLFAAGVLAFQAFLGRRRHVTFAAFGFTWLAALSLLQNRVEMIVVSLIFLTFGMLVLKRDLLGAFTARPLVWVGSISYSLYLLHQNIGVAVLTSLPTNWPLWAYGISALALIGGFMAHAWGIVIAVEKPAQTLARRLDRKAELA